MVKMNLRSIAYMVGFFGSIVAGLLMSLSVFEMTALVSTILIISGLIIGFANVGDGEKVPMMINWSWSWGTG